MARERQSDRTDTSVRSSARQLILEAAVTAFEREGFQAASVDSIAEAAGVARRTVYHHFKTKNDILVEATVEQAHLFLVDLKQSVKPGADFPTFVVESLVHVVRKSPTSRFFMLQMARGVAVESATIYFNHPTLISEWLQHFREPYIEALRTGQINPAVTLPDLLKWFGRVATSFLQYPAGEQSKKELRATLELFVGGALRYRATGAARIR